MTRKSAPPKTSGMAAPDRIFSELAARKVTSSAQSGPIRASAPTSGHFQSRRTTMKASEVVTTMVPVTASP